jgi:hypothetical protein
MEERVIELAKSLRGVSGGQEELLERLCRAACQRLDRRLREGVTAEDCADAYVTAAVWLALAGLSGQSGGVSRFSAGDLTVEKSSGEASDMEKRAWRLMAPYVRDDDFVFRGVRG